MNLDLEGNYGWNLGLKGDWRMGIVLSVEHLMDLFSQYEWECEEDTASKNKIWY